MSSTSWKQVVGLFFSFQPLACFDGQVFIYLPALGYMILISVSTKRLI